MIPRSLSSTIQRKLKGNKLILLFGPNSTGKFTLLKQILEQIDPDYIILDCKDPVIQKKLSSINLQAINELTQGRKTVLIIDIQKIQAFEDKIKFLKEYLIDNQIFISSSLLTETSAESLNAPADFGLNYILYPIAWQEFSDYSLSTDYRSLLETRLVYGMYPQVVSNPGKEPELLDEIFKNFNNRNPLENIRKPHILTRLFQELALNIGMDISLNELGARVKADKNTVGTYITFLKKAFLIFDLKPLCRNHIHEVKSTRKIYFFDNGLRNRILSNFNSVDLRDDAEQLWANFCISERYKFLVYLQRQVNSFYWRTTGGKTIDYLEEYEDGLHAFQFKWNRNSNKHFNKTFLNSYPQSTSDIITPANCTKFLSSAKIRF